MASLNWAAAAAASAVWALAKATFSAARALSCLGLALAALALAASLLMNRESRGLPFQEWGLPKKCFRVLAMGALVAFSFFLESAALNQGYGLEGSLGLLGRHDFIGPRYLFIHALGSRVEENQHSHDQDEKADPYGPVIFLFPQLGYSALAGVDYHPGGLGILFISPCDISSLFGIEPSRRAYFPRLAALSKELGSVALLRRLRRRLGAPPALHRGDRPIQPVKSKACARKYKCGTS